MIQKSKYQVTIGKLLSILSIFFSAFSHQAFSQGFDWQYSSRLPSSYPKFFLGGNISGIYAFHSADIYSLGEEYRCGDYKKGTETGLSVSAACEYWQTGSLAFWGMVGFRTSTVHFTSQTQPEPFRLNGEEFQLTREFAMDAHLQAISFDVGIKHRIARTHLHIGVGVRTEIVLTTTAQQTETILTPVNITGSIDYGVQPLTGMRRMVLTPIITTGYDAELGKGIYATPRIMIGLPLMNRAKSIDWTSIEISGGVSFFLSF